MSPVYKAIAILIIMLSLATGCQSSESAAIPVSPTKPLLPPTAIQRTESPIVTPHTVGITSTPRVLEATSTPTSPAPPLLPTSEPAGERISLTNNGQSLGTAQSWDIAWEIWMVMATWICL